MSTQCTKYRTIPYGVTYKNFVQFSGGRLRPPPPPPDSPLSCIAYRTGALL